MYLIKKFVLFTIGLLCCFLLGNCEGQVATTSDTYAKREHLIRDITEKIDSQKQEIKNYDGSKIEECVHYLVDHMPNSDLSLSVTYFVDNIILAWTARETFEWGKKVPWKLFLNDVLPYASLTEPRDNWRPMFHEHMSKLIGKSKSTTDAALAVNLKSWDIVSPKIIYAPGGATGINSYSPFETMKRHNASCTGLSVFLVDALRSVGVPARVAGTPHWNKDKSKCPLGDQSANCGNHDWVEFWGSDDQLWHFLDQGGSEGVPDAGWFYPDATDTQQPMAGNHSIYATSWAPTDKLPTKLYPKSYPVHHFPMVWEWRNVNVNVNAWDVTKRYLEHDSLHEHQQTELATEE